VSWPESGLHFSVEESAAYLRSIFPNYPDLGDQRTAPDRTAFLATIRGDSLLTEINSMRLSGHRVPMNTQKGRASSVCVAIIESDPLRIAGFKRIDTAECP
jgi:hypothetical protein